MGVEQASTADGARAVLGSDAGTSEQRRSFVHQDNGFYQIMADHSDKCLAVEGNAVVTHASCGSGTDERWRIEPLNDGTIRLVAREGGKVLDVKDCHMANAAIIQQWS